MVYVRHGIIVRNRNWTVRSNEIQVREAVLELYFEEDWCGG